MNFEYKHLLDEDFDPGSRVWIYQSSRLFTVSEALQIEEMINQFAQNWLSHGIPVKGAAHLFFGKFVVLIADESATGVSGCSTDSSVRLIKEIEKIFGVNMFDRLALAFIDKDKVQILPMPQLKYAVEQGFITADTLFFNNVVLTKEELENNWIIPVKDSWLAKKISFRNTVS
ncbi:MAG TPA: hypothetical protein VFD24_09520 [Chitinophagaceae bacterium]|jgi:hypothetical protein|nr:hypothetical protein [Chitinophagaceae bacterium]